ncbi:MAG: HAMP domain-containing sensor histidine kinase [Actinomycetota bacterium]
MRRLAFRTRLTLLFATTFLAAGAVLIAVMYVLVARQLDRPFGDPTANGVDVPEELAELVEDGAPLPRGPLRRADEIVLSDGRTVLEFAQDVQDGVVDETLASLVRWSALAVLVVSAAAVAVGWWAASRALAPMRQVTDTARRLSSHDLTERVRYDGPPDELRELADTFDEMLDRIERGVDSHQQFAAMASHELQTPLTTIRALSDNALADPAGTDVRTLATSTRDAARRSSELIQDLLELARSQAGLGSMQRVDLAGLLGEVVGERIEQADEAGIRLELEVGPEPVVVDGDPGLLRSLLTNLVDNAVRHNDPVGGWASSAVVVEHGRAVVEIANSGPRLDPADLQRVSQPFQRGMRNPDELGHGLGLTVVRTIVAAHDGVARLTALPQGGMRAVVSFPLAGP